MSGSIRKFATLLFLLFLIFAPIPFSAFAQTNIATVRVENYPFGVAANPTTNLIYVSNWGSSSVSVVNGFDNTVVGRIPIDTSPEGIGANPQTNLIYVATGFNFIRVIDGTTNTVVGTIPVEVASNAVAVNSNTNRIYVTNRGCCPGNSVSVIDGATNSVIATIPVGLSPRGVAVNTNTNRIYIANNSGRSVSVIDGSSNSLVTTINLAGYPFGVAVNPNTNLIYVTSHVTNTVEVIDGSTNTIINSIPLPISGQFTLGVNPNSNRVFVAAIDKLFIIDAYTNQVVSTLPLGLGAAGGGANSVAVNTTTNRIYVANFNGNTISVIQDSVNQPPIVNAGGPYSVDEGGTIQVDATGQDPEDEPLTYAWDLDNNGSFETLGQNVTFSAVDLDGPSNRTIAVQVTDSGSLTATDTAFVTINNVAPVVGTITTPLDPVQVNTIVNTSASFMDAGILDTHAAVWDWGDSTTSSGVLTESNGSGSVTGSHSYTSAGVYTVTLTVIDDDLGSGSNQFEYVVVYNPNGGFLTGSGRYDAPSGSIPSEPARSGFTKFGTNAKYVNNVLTGATRLKFKDEGYVFDFDSTSYEWLVVTNGNQAELRGRGTINGSGNYNFQLTVFDGSPDTVRIRIWDETNTIVYDNNTSSLISGNIKVHN